MNCVLAVFFLLAEPFWLSMPPAQWDEEQLEQFLSDSPWARPAETVALRGAAQSATRTFLATAAPVRLAEEEWRRRRMPRELRSGDLAWEEWQEFLAKDGHRYLVLAVAIPFPFSADAHEMAEMESQSLMRLGRKKVKLSGYFPSTERDPFTRLIFPRAGADAAKEIIFELYIPGEGGNFREAVYLTKELAWKGKKEF